MLSAISLFVLDFQLLIGNFGRTYIVSMALPLNLSEDFLELFYHEIKDRELDRSNKLNLFTLKVKNNSFAYDELLETLGDKLYYFALSRAEIQKLKDTDKLGTLIKKSKKKLREHIEKNRSETTEGVKNEGGELGELLLFCLLESHLKAPKILTKLELKTASQMYVHGADGVHLLQLNEKDYQLIFGESKLHADIKQGIYKAFESISKLISAKGAKLDFEIDLVNSQLIKETYSAAMHEQLKKLIVPSAREDVTNLDYSFGIFLGFNIEITAEEKGKANPEFRTYIREKITKQIEENIASINFQIAKENFTGYSFYVYVIPFSDLGTNREEIVNQLAR